MSPLAVGLIVLAVILLLLIVAAIVSLTSSSKKTYTAADDDLALVDGHDHAKGEAGCPACQASAEAIKKKVPEKCLVIIRPQTSWQGEFGFDWLRVGDSGLAGDKDLTTGLVGKYGAIYATEPGAVLTPDNAKLNSLKGEYYKPFPIPWKKKKDGKPYVYFTPVLALFPKDQCTPANNKQYKATLALNIEVVGHEPDVLRLVYNTELFEIDKTELPKTVGANPADITIQCKQEFDTDQEIKIVPYKESEDEVVGKIIVVRNNKGNRYKAKIVFVKVQTNINGIEKSLTALDIATERSFLEKYMYQSLTSLEFNEATLDLRTNADFNSNYTMLNGAKRVVKNATGPKPLHAYFRESLKGYDDWYKVFFVDEAGGDMDGGIFAQLNGCAENIPSKAVICYNGHNTETTTHELLHAMGLPHTFDNDGDYTYKIGQTDNIMDYSHQSKFGSLTRLSTWRWQWNKLRPNLKKE